MSIFYNNDVNDFMEYNKSSNHVTINDIISQVYNVNNTTAMKIANEYINKHSTKTKKQGAE